MLPFSEEFPPMPRNWTLGAMKSGAARPGSEDSERGLGFYEGLGFRVSGLLRISSSQWLSLGS